MRINTSPFTLLKAASPILVTLAPKIRELIDIPLNEFLPILVTALPTTRVSMGLFENIQLSMLVKESPIINEVISFPEKASE